MNPQVPANLLEPTHISKVFTAFADIPSIGFIGLPLAYLYWSFKTAISYYKDNGKFHNEIQEIIDRKAFQKIVIPLFGYISSTLSEEITPELGSDPAASKEEFLREMDEKKLALLKQRDFSYLEPAVEFQDVIEKVLKSKKNQLTLKTLIKSCRAIIISLTVVNFITVLSGIVLVYVKNVSGNEMVAEKILYIWLAFLILSVLLGIIYFIKSIKIEGLKND